MEAEEHRFHRKLENVHIRRGINSFVGVRPASFQRLYEVNHGSCKSSFAVGLSLGSSFIIFAMKSLSGIASSSSSDLENGSHFWFSWM